MRELFHACAAGALLAAGVVAAHAQAPSSYPDRPIRLVVAFVAGGATDTLARQISNDLKEALGQPVVVENRPGANGYLAWTHVASAEPDGYTLLLAENALAISQALHKKATSSFDPLTQYDAIAAVATSPSAIVLANNVPANNIAELVAHSRTVPQKMNFASAGVGSVSHLTFEVFKDGVGIEAIHIPYKGGGQSIGDVIAGHVPMASTSVQVAKSLVEGGKIKAIAVTSAARSPALPNVPSLKEAGVKTADVELGFWYGIFGPKGMPDAVKAKLEQAVAAVTADARVRERMAKLDITPGFAPAAALRTKLESEIRNWTKFIDAKGIKPE
ncbi:MAG TPA: tripartite tricarboxylate transporter substrate binding protein [Xanthobacteraceae bacterium]|nr:tripartite tricarboxylate transporter substrate binding protein [Xanthobacteraceae bacterium]